ncbi:efflux RND transporter periplasmic adaptor subunit [Salegentibacter mishustinae]|uniref:Cation transporter n=1 Tax=Salegentibacter mishustinae TaxID=270918 RepID=A0A0Q9ZAS8_9FLAO|nr:efflux RND transporter periplasmic adaptor subunit [Salegentibacter mishustinae]KRG29257.1 cation transporter [Salegentibacter mishustinae]PNW21694.1 cation transporter [Salegentibacter mishustinae]PZX65034.1 cobalt-zinc-cadmium efflux system membrane fusion protein [Salegentibacter mishustinae]GGW87715.1 hemolysin D [Salegentibacter mishustinae]
MTNNLKSILILLAVLLMSSCGDSEKENSEETATNSSDGGIQLSFAQFEGSDMELGEIEENSFPISVETTGMIDVPPENKAMVSSFADGYVRETPLLIGDEVKKGQFLVSLENPDYVQMQQDYLDAMEQMNYLKSEYQRQKTLLEEKITSERNFLKAESEYKRNQAKYRALRKKLQMLNLNPEAVEKGNISSMIRIYAPITGSITEMKINNGMYVSAADELMQIIDRDHLHIELNVFEKDVMKLKKGQNIRFIIPEANTDTIEGKVHLVGTSIDEQKRNVKVHGHFIDEQKKNSFATGMFVEAEIIIDKRKAKALPAESIVSLDNTSYVLVLDTKTDSNYIFKRREVLPGDTFNGFTIIKNSADFKQDDQFLTKGAFTLITE